MDVTSAINRIQALWLTVPGVRAAPNEPPDKLDPFPIAVTFERTGALDVSDMYSGTFSKQTGTIWSELHVLRTDLARAVRMAMTFRNALLDTLRDDPTLNNNVMLITAIRWTFGPLQWNGIDTTGYRFEIDVVLELTQ